MGDSATNVVAIMLAAFLIFLFPLMDMSNKVDRDAKLSIQTYTTEFIDKITTTGILNQEDYENFIATLATTGNTYDVNINIQVLDVMPIEEKQNNNARIGENVYYNLYNTQILESLYENQKIQLKHGDIVTIDVENLNLTIYQQIRKFFYKLAGASERILTAEATGLVGKQKMTIASEVDDEPDDPSLLKYSPFSVIQIDKGDVVSEGEYIDCRIKTKEDKYNPYFMNSKYDDTPYDDSYNSDIYKDPPEGLDIVVKYGNEYIFENKYSSIDEFLIEWNRLGKVEDKEDGMEGIFWEPDEGFQDKDGNDIVHDNGYHYHVSMNGLTSYEYIYIKYIVYGKTYIIVYEKAGNEDAEYKWKSPIMFIGEEKLE